MINLYRAVKSAHLNQPFAYNQSIAKVDATGKPILPYVISTIGQGASVPPGYVLFYPLLGMKGHDGDDWAAYHGEPVYFGATDGKGNPIEGTCYDAADNDGGLGVDVVFQDPDTGKWAKLREWHFLNSAVANGQKIKSGDLIGHADSTGASSGDHCHEGYKPLNSSNPSDQTFAGNGYNAAVDPRTVPDITNNRDNNFVLDVLNLEQQLTLVQQIYRLLAILKGRGK